MSRKSSMGGAPGPAPAAAGLPGPQPPRRAGEFMGYEPTPGQRLVKAKFWHAYKDDPSVDPSAVTASYVAARVDAPSIAKWWVDPSFRTWFLGRDDFRPRADAAVGMWLDTALRRLTSGEMSDKDLIQLGKLLADVAGKTTKSAGDGESESGGRKPQLTPAQQREMVGRAALALGWQPPKLVEAASSPSPSPEDGGQDE